MKRYSKYEMLNIFQDIFQTNYIIEPYRTQEDINRCLIPMVISKSLEEQLMELKVEIW